MAEQQPMRTFRVSWAPTAVRDATERLRLLVHVLGECEGTPVARVRGGPDGGLNVAGVTLTWTHLACLLDTARAVVAELDPAPEVQRG